MPREANDTPTPAQPAPELMTADDLIVYLRLDDGAGDARERLRNLMRRQGLPTIRRGRLIRFRKSSVDAWLAAGERGRKS